VWLVLSAPTDESALWACQALKAGGLTPLEHVTPGRLGQGLRWEQRLGVDGAGVDIQLSDGLTITGDTVRGVLNRLVSVPFETLRHAHPADRDYAAQELTAFFVSWLYCLPCPVLNRPTPQGLSGAWRHLSEWIWMAARAGLPTPPYRHGSRDPLADDRDPLAHDDIQHWRRANFPAPVHMRTVFVLEGEVVGDPVATTLGGACRELAALAGAELLEIDLVLDSGRAWTFAGATVLPDLRLGGDALLDVLAAALTRSPGRR
jgi:hypothetical protein